MNDQTINMFVSEMGHPEKRYQMHEDGRAGCYIEAYSLTTTRDGRIYFSKSSNEISLGEAFYLNDHDKIIYVVELNGKKFDIEQVVLRSQRQKQMTEEHKGLPVAGYLPQTDEKVAMVNINKELEERLLRRIEWFESENNEVVKQNFIGLKMDEKPLLYDAEMLNDAKKGIIAACMLLNRAVFRPARVKLPEDDITPNQTTIDAMNDSRNGVGMTRVGSVKELMEKLDDDKENEGDV